MPVIHYPEERQGRERVIRLVRPSVVVLFGPAGCGKSTFAARHFRLTQIISSDHCRALVCDEEHDQRFNDQAFALLDFIIEQRLSINRLCVIDSTALTAAARKSLIGLAGKYRVPCFLLSFEVEFETCVIRDRHRGAEGRGRSVGRPIIERQYRMFEEARSAVAGEGFDQIEILRNGETDAVRFETVFRPAPRATSPAHITWQGHLAEAAGTRQEITPDRRLSESTGTASPARRTPAAPSSQGAAVDESHASSMPRVSGRRPATPPAPHNPEHHSGDDVGSAGLPESPSTDSQPVE
jgi:predicted kinase